ncbi:hypothetical protein J7K44_01805 [bacterium]|nr:hypothetical protein [bacterium]
MNLDEIKEIVKIDGGKFIIVEDGKPVLVITNFEDYKRMIGLFSQKGKENPHLDSLSNSNSQESISQEKKVSNESSEEELTIDDLPF